MGEGDSPTVIEIKKLRARIASLEEKAVNTDKQQAEIEALKAKIEKKGKADPDFIDWDAE